MDAAGPSALDAGQSTQVNGLGARMRRFLVADWSSRVAMGARLLRRIALLPVLVSFEVAILALLWIAKCIYPGFQTGRLLYDRVGHLSDNTEVFLRRRSTDLQKRVCLFLSGTPSNHQLLKMIRRRITVVRVPDSVLKMVQARFQRSAERARVWVNLKSTGDEFEEYNRIKPQLSFTPEEEARGRALLSRMGIEPSAPFICFHSRDGAYLRRQHTYWTAKKWQYHDYRDSEIETYLAATEYLTAQGFYAVRMGFEVPSDLLTSNPRIIDYATRFRSDFGDMYLCGRCEFFLGSTAGICTVPYVLGRPSAFANWIPIGVTPRYDRDLFIPKRIYSDRLGRILSFREIVQMGADRWNHSEWYREAGLRVINSPSEEIRDLAEEMVLRLQGRWSEPVEAETLRERFRAVFPADHRCRRAPLRVASRFLLQNPELFA
ncbi:MAG: hypothetical protein CME26_03025 [Gemmatimonadetes bacterium]|nr:hypothetical protein [Gemmatimonadota bacterium]|tara:strand:- start:9894 stop:11192 length:1299 start_codon:yes stop_codon:yes gene_type:complete